MKYFMQVEIEADQFVPEEDKIPKGVISDGPNSPLTDSRASWMLKSGNGASYIRSGDYVITQGDQKYIMPKEMFERTYKKSTES
jgi:hypothetical protein